MSVDLNTLRSARARQGLRPFLEQMVINCRPHARPFGEIADPWQWTDVLNPIIPAVETIAGLNNDTLRYDTFVNIMPKGSDKTSLGGRIVTWCINYSRRPMSIVVCARDRDQARGLRDAMEEERILNPWLPASYKINAYDAIGPTGTLEILSSDAKGGHGKRASIYVMDEWTMFGSRELSDMVMSSSTKYVNSIVIILSNAGYKGTFQHKVFEDLKRDDRCYIFEPQGIMASWTDRRKVERARQRLAPTEAQRLYDNRWIEGGEDPAFPAELVQEMFRLTQPCDVLLPMLGDMDE